jgi:glycosyltransferase involved in cell wall biosynthesis
MISVVVPVYNVARSLPACLESLAAQSHNDWECILVDDGSTDGSGGLCDSFCEAHGLEHGGPERASRHDSRGGFRVIHTPNRGASAARNTGIEAALGEFIVFVDADDTLDPRHLSALAAAMGDNDLALCGIRRVGPAAGAETVVTPAAGTVTVDQTGADPFVELNRLHLLYGPVCKLYRAEMLRRHNIRFPVGVHFGEDLMFNFAVLEHVRTIGVVAEPLYNYLLAATGSLSTSAASRDFHTILDQWNIIRRFFARRGIDTPAAHRYLSNRLWGLAYDTVMSRKMSLRELGRAFDAGFINRLRAFDSPTNPIPAWLRRSILNRNLTAIWLIQRIPR